VLSGKSANGVRFAILVGGREAWGHTQGVGKAASHVVDLSAHAGRAVQVTLQVDGLGDASYDWANWVRPVIVHAPGM
jgi:hypothetical protein